MARYTGAVCRLCRREGQKLYLKGERCYTGKCGFERRSFAPGQHGMSRKKLSGYGVQLREKQKVRRYYGVLEKQFRKYFAMAEKKQGITGENMLAILESRFDNVVYRLGLAMSRAEARQLIRHGHFSINGKKADVCSILLKPGDVVAAIDKGEEKIKNNLEANASRVIPKWLDFDANTATGKMLAMAAREDIDLPIEEHHIVELYSK
ncbi:MAG: 30S ribosomal protein S4 [Clostridia bacterium]|nr:30S ribosomal protein S4 [Clostridia bacterium]